MTVTTTFGLLRENDLHLYATDSVSLANGGLAAINGGSGYVFDSGGTQILTLPNFTSPLTRIDQLSNGNLVLTGSQNGVSSFSILNSVTGATVVRRTVTPQPISGDADVVALPGGGFWITDTSVVQNNWNVEILRYNNRGVFQDRIVIDDGPESDVLTRSIELANGNVAVFWKRSGPVPAHWMAVLAPDGSYVTPPKPLAGVTASSTISSIVATDDGFALANIDTRGRDMWDVLVRQFDAAGNLLLTTNVTNPSNQSLLKTGTIQQANICFTQSGQIAVAYQIWLPILPDFPDDVAEAFILTLDADSGAILQNHMLYSFRLLFGTDFGLLPAAFGEDRIHLFSGGDLSGSYVETKIQTSDGAGDTMTGGPGVDDLRGNGGDDVASGLGGNDYLWGGDGNDQLNGGDGNDLLDGGAGLDLMVGGGGDDTYRVDSASDRIVEAAGGGKDTVISSFNYALAAELEELVLASGAGNISGTGNALNNRITGNEGNNVLNGRQGDDIMIGGMGEDTYFVDSPRDQTIEAFSAGYDTVRSPLNWTLAEGIDNLILSGYAISGTGNDLPNSIYGTKASNILDGRGGIDLFVGYAGNDRYTVDSTEDKIVEVAGMGTDTVFASSSYILPANVERLTLMGSAGSAAFGNGMRNLIAGNSGNNIIDGREGADNLTGGAGADTFRFTTIIGSGHVDTIADFNPVNDTIQLSPAVFSALASGQLDASAFHTGGGATTSLHRIIYNPLGGALYYDADGAGGAAPLRFANLGQNLAMSSADFLVA